MMEDITAQQGKFLEATKIYMDSQAQINQQYLQTLSEIAKSQIESAMPYTKDQVEDMVKSFYKMADAK